MKPKPRAGRGINRRYLRDAVVTPRRRPRRRVHRAAAPVVIFGARADESVKCLSSTIMYHIRSALAQRRCARARYVQVSVPLTHPEDPDAIAALLGTPLVTKGTDRVWKFSDVADINSALLPTDWHRHSNIECVTRLRTGRRKGGIIDIQERAYPVRISLESATRDGIMCTFFRLRSRIRTVMGSDKNRSGSPLRLSDISL